MLTGEHPSKKLCTGKWQRIVNKCTRINPKDRYNNVKELEADLSTNKLIAPLVMSAIIVLVAITIVMCSSRNKPQNTTPETMLADAQYEATKNTDEKETTSTKETTTVLETTTEDVTTEPPTTVVEVPTTEQATSQEATTKYEEPTTEEPTTEEPTELNYTITLEGTEITVSGNGKISKGKNFYFTDPYISSKERERLNSAVFCEGITNIPSGAFLNCGSFGEITIPNTVIDIEDHALFGTTVQVVEIPESVEYLGESAFSGNNVLSIVNLSEGLKTIDYACFSGCGSLASIVIPESVEYIGVSAFSGTRLRSIVLPSKLKKLEKDTFLICEYLKGITLPDTLESIGDYCFGS